MSSSPLLRGDLLLHREASELRLVQVTDTHLNGTTDGELLGNEHSALRTCGHRCC